jgi:hypothetical protein
MAERISENINSAGQEAGEPNPAERTLDELCAATLKRRGRRGRPKGTGRKHTEKCAPKTSRNFSPLSRLLLIEIGWTDDELRKQTEAEIVEEALVRMARSLSNQNPRLEERLARWGR